MREGAGRPAGACWPPSPWLCLPPSPRAQDQMAQVGGSLSPQWAAAEPTLQIPSVGFEDEGTYECETENAKGHDTVQGRIIVQGSRPAGAAAPPSVPERRPLSCRAHGDATEV